MMLNKIESLAHSVSMRGLKIGAQVMPFMWPKVFEGQGAALNMCDEIIKRRRRAVFFVTSKTPLRSGIAQPLIDRLEAEGVAVTVYDEIRPDPTVEQIEEAVKKLKAGRCDTVLALGGGSVIDAAKMIAARGRNRKSARDMAGMFKVTRGMLPLYAVPTTAGTGSEVTIAAVVTDPAAQRKLPVLDPRLMPKAAALDGALMVGVPPAITADTGMDALTHAVEAYISLNALPRTDQLALEATQLIMANLETVFEQGDNVEGRQAMARAAYLAGKAFTQSGVGYVHAIAHNFGGLYHVPHGHANAIVMPYVLEYSLPACADRLASLAAACDIGDASMSSQQRGQAFIDHIRAMNKHFGIPEQLDSLKAQDIPRIARAAREEARFTYAVPRFMRQKDCERLIGKMLVA